MSKHDTPIDEVKSSLQKEIRRAKSTEAIKWGDELYHRVGSKEAWERLLIIVREDAPDTLLYFDSCRRHASESNSHDFAGDQHFYLLAVRCAAEGLKDRRVDEVIHAQVAAFVGWKPAGKLLVPAYANDRHVRRYYHTPGHTKTGYSKFVTEGVVCVNPTPEYTLWHKDWVPAMKEANLGYRQIQRILKELSKSVSQGP